MQTDPQTTILWIQSGIFAVQAIVLIIQTFVFARQAKRLKETVDSSTQQSALMTEYIHQATRTAIASETSAEAMTVNSRVVVELSERSAMQIRAYVSVLIAEGLYQDNNFRFGVKPTVVNTGQTPATRVRFTARAEVLPFPLPDDFSFGPLAEPSSIFGAIPPHHNYSINRAVDERFDDPDSEDIKRSNGRRVYIWGTVIYEDVFEEEHRTDFAHSIYWIRFRDESERLFGDYSDRHNGIT